MWLPEQLTSSLIFLFCGTAARTVGGRRFLAFGACLFWLRAVRDFLFCCFLVTVTIYSFVVKILCGSLTASLIWHSTIVALHAVWFIFEAGAPELLTRSLSYLKKKSGYATCYF